MSEDAEESAAHYVPGSMPLSSFAIAKSRWYRRPWVVLLSSIVVVVGVSILLDLPQPISNADDVASQSSSVRSINQDLRQCGYALQEAYSIYGHLVKRQLSPFELAHGDSMLKDDQTACSFTSTSIFDLTNNIQIQDTLAGRHIDRMLTTVTIWATSDALTVVVDVQRLYKNPGNLAAAHELISELPVLAKDRASAFGDVRAADQLLHAQLPWPALPAVPVR